MLNPIVKSEVRLVKKPIPPPQRLTALSCHKYPWSGFICVPEQNPIVTTQSFTLCLFHLTGQSWGSIENSGAQRGNSALESTLPPCKWTPECLFPRRKGQQQTIPPGTHLHLSLLDHPPTTLPGYLPLFPPWLWHLGHQEQTTYATVLSHSAVNRQTVP